MRDLSEIESFSETVSLVCSAGLDPSRWQEVLDRLRIEAGGISAYMFGYDFAAGRDLGFIASDHDEDYNIFFGGLYRFRIDRLIHAEKMRRAEAQKGNGFHLQWEKLQEDLREVGGVIFHQSHDRMFALGCNIRTMYSDPFEAHWMKMVQLLRPHLAHALDINRNLISRRLVDSIMAPIQGVAEQAFVVLSEQGKLLYASDAASVILTIGQLIRCNALNCVSFTDRSAAVTFRRALHALQTDPVLPVLSCMSSRAAPGPAQAYRFIAFRGELGAASGLGVVCGINEKCLLVTIAEEPCDEAPLDHLARVYRLTPAEFQIAEMLSDGRSVKDIAEIRTSSVATVRNQIKSAMTKVGVRRRLDLLRLVDRRLARQM